MIDISSSIEVNTLSLKSRNISERRVYWFGRSKNSIPQDRVEAIDVLLPFPNTNGAQKTAGHSDRRGGECEYSIMASAETKTPRIEDDRFFHLRRSDVLYL
jgi:hypothetical protein